MRKHLSVLGLAARGAVGRVLLITVLTAALAGALLYLVPAQTPSQSTVYPDGEVVETYTPSDYCYLPSRTGATVVCAVGLAGVMAVLSLNGCGYGTKTDLTMRRLRIGEGAANLWWMALNAVCLLFYWAVMAAVCVAVVKLRVDNVQMPYGSYTPGPQTLLLSVYAGSFLHHLLPLRDAAVWLENLLLTALCAVSPFVAGAAMSSLQRPGADTPATSYDGAQAEYILRDYEGYVSVFASGADRKPLQVTGIEVAGLRRADQELLRGGITVGSQEQLLLLLEDLGS